jgi:hypothetical protein
VAIALGGCNAQYLSLYFQRAGVGLFDFRLCATVHFLVGQKRKTIGLCYVASNREHHCLLWRSSCGSREANSLILSKANDVEVKSTM